MRLEMKIPPICLPVSVLEAKRSLRLEEYNTTEDTFIEDLIRSAAYDAENKTSRVLVSSVWEWLPEPNEMQIGVEIALPIVPVTSVIVYDLDAVTEDTNSSEPSLPDQKQVPVPDTTFKVLLPSLAPQGRPLVGTITPLEGFPSNARIELTVGYPVEEIVTSFPPVNPDNPELPYVLDIVVDSTGYATVGTLYIEVSNGEIPSNPDIKTNAEKNIITLVFTGKVKGEISKENFTITPFTEEVTQNSDTGSDVITIIKGVALEILNAIIDVELGVVKLEFEKGTLVEGQRLYLDFAGGILEDNFGNFVPIIVEKELPTVILPKDFNAPADDPAEVEYNSLCPDPIKRWIQTRVATLYQQRSEIALRAGKSNDALFEHRFIDSLLDPYILRSMH